MSLHRTRRLAVLGALPLALAALLSPVARAAGWVANGVPLTLAANDQTAPMAIADAQGGAYFVWLDKRSGTAELYAQHVNGAGNLIAGWPADGLAVVTGVVTLQSPAVSSDGQGGAYVVWTDARAGNPDVYAQHLAAGGLAAGWPANGLAVCTATGTQENPVACADGSGGALVAWSDVRGANEDVYVQHVLTGGTVDGAWTAQGALLCNAAHEQQFPTIVPDGAAGAVVAWVDHRNAGALTPQKDIFAGHMGATGVPDPAWTANGVALCVVANFDQDLPRAVSDGAGGAIVAWNDARNGTAQVPDPDIYATRIRADGTLAPGWPLNGESVARVAGDQSGPVLVADGQDGAILAWQDGRDTTTFPTNTDVFAQHFAADGSRVAGWPADGLDLSVQPNRQDAPAMVADGQGGALVVWKDGRPGANIYAQHVRGDATFPAGWPADGIALTSLTTNEVAPTLASDGTGGALCGWQDDRNGGSNNDIFAQRFYGSGQVGPTVGVPGGRGAGAPGAGGTALALALAGADPARGMARFRLDLPAAGPFAAQVFDTSGRIVATLSGSAAAAGSQALTWDGRTGTGARAPAGVYHLRVVVGSARAAIRFVFLP